MSCDDKAVTLERLRWNQFATPSFGLTSDRCKAMHHLSEQRSDRAWDRMSSQVVRSDRTPMPGCAWLVVDALDRPCTYCVQCLAADRFAVA